ncbi:recombinase family protein [Pseudidiomarina marina]|uniref:Resolvase n=1 Tax=Pseudidiomarina marina TaxID=502366 RepID=A0A432YCD5_9GAMM|nr:recombinase family protein [Pseudidiomarina marina]RUO58668.1 resolvase [Pseudidiomarina marina]
MIVGYLRVSSDQQSNDSQRMSIDERFKIERWYQDNSTSGLTKGSERKGLGELLEFVRDGDTVVVYAIDRLGRNTIDVLETVEVLNKKNVALISLREGFDLTTDHGKLLLTMLAGLAELERKNIYARQMAGIKNAREKGKLLGRRKSIDDQSVRDWRVCNNASIRETAEHFGISISSVKRSCSLKK